MLVWENKHLHYNLILKMYSAINQSTSEIKKWLEWLQCDLTIFSQLFMVQTFLN